MCNETPQQLAEGDYPDRGPLLFGEGFVGQAKAAAVPESPQSVGRVKPKPTEDSVQMSGSTKQAPAKQL